MSTASDALLGYCRAWEYMTEAERAEAMPQLQAEPMATTRGTYVLARKDADQTERQTLAMFLERGMVVVK